MRDIPCSVVVKFDQLADAVSFGGHDRIAAVVTPIEQDQLGDLEGGEGIDRAGGQSPHSFRMRLQVQPALAELSGPRRHGIESM